MVAAFEKALEKVSAEAQAISELDSYNLRRQLALQIIEAANEGLNDPDALSEAAVSGVRAGIHLRVVEKSTSEPLALLAVPRRRRWNY